MKQADRIILDLRGIVLHSYYSAVPSDGVRDEKGELRQSAVDGLDSFILKYLQPILQIAPPVNIIGVLEGSNARRRALLPEYKDKKSQDEDDKVIAAEKDRLLTAVQKLLLGIGALLVKTPNAEADDTIGYLCERLEGSKLVHTVDGDLLQLTAPGVGVIQKLEYKESFKGKMTKAVPLQPHNIVAVYKSICGDSTDGYVGVRGMGPAAFERLLDQYGADGMKQLEACVADGDFALVEEALRDNYSKELEKLWQARDEWMTSYKLAKIHPEWCEVSFNDKVTRPNWAKRVPSEDRVRAVLEPMGLMHHFDHFKRFLPRKWLCDKMHYASTNREALLKAMRESRFVTFDYESYDKLKHPAYQEAKPGYIDALSQVITGCSFCFGSNFQYSFYMPTKHRDTRNLEVEQIAGMFDQLDGQTLIAHNSMFEQVVTFTNMQGKRLKNVLDTVIMGNYFDENYGSGLKLRSKRELNYDQITYKQVVKEGDMRDVSGMEVLDYGCDDSIVTAHLAVLYNVVMECERTWHLYEENEPYFEQAMLKSFITGVPLNYERLAQLSRDDDKLYDETYAALRTLLTEHCLETNHDGFAQLWPEIESFERAKCADNARKQKEKEELKLKAAYPTAEQWMENACDARLLEVEQRWEQIGNDKLAKKKQEIYAACKYNPIQPPVLALVRKDISQIARYLCLPPVRSIKPDWLFKYCTGIEDQVARGAEIAAEQQVFVGLLKAASSLTQDGIDNLEAWMNEIARAEVGFWSGDLLNAGSTNQMAHLFYGKMGLPILLRNQSKDGEDQRSQFALPGAPSTNENAIRTWLMEMKEEEWQYKVLKCILEIRGVRTRRGLYYSKYPLWQSPVDLKTHPQVRNFGTVTGRPSGTSYNIFQVSKTKDDGRIRSVFNPQSPDELIVSIDFDQEELVIGAGETGDENLRACYTGEVRTDVHTRTGLEIYNVRNKDKKPISYDEFVALLAAEHKEATVIRKVYAKRTNFLEFYGGGPKGMARKIIVPLAMAEQFDEAFHKAYPRVREYQERCAKQARRYGFVTTCFGTRRHLPNICDKNKAKQASAERQAGNYPIQGGAAFVLKKVLKEYVLQRVEERFGVTIYGPVYDELVASVPKQHVYDYLETMANIMEMELPGLNISLRTSVSIGHNWGEQHELKRRPSREKIEQTIRVIEESISQLKEAA
jgi:DNA polymerase I-like protein with 3'-5' exonuclease and polymerase domains/5'-3' exonuclease